MSKTQEKVKQEKNTTNTLKKEPTDLSESKRSGTETKHFAMRSLASPIMRLQLNRLPPKTPTHSPAPHKFLSEAMYSPLSPQMRVPPSTPTAFKVNSPSHVCSINLYCLLIDN